MNFDWTNFYMEFADKLLPYKNNRKELIDKMKLIDNIDISKYELIIETSDLSLYDESMLKNEKVNAIYTLLKDVGKCFNK